MYTPTPKLTKAKRLSIYKKALEFTTSDEGNHPVWGPRPEDAGLCLLLPAIWLDVNWGDDFYDYEGNEFTYRDVPNYFPEFGKYYRRGDYEGNQEHRIAVLTEIIHDMSE